MTVVQTRFSHKLFEPMPYTISEGKTHCVMIFDKLKLQREQGRFCDVILKVYGREFPAHRCVLASCSHWFDTRFKVHKTLKEVIEVENCKNYEVFHLVLTYMYSGQVVIDKDNVADILEISHTYSINKLKTYCAEFLERNLKAANCLHVMEMAEKYHLIDLSKQTLAFIHKHFDHIVQYHEIDKKVFSDLEQYIQRAWCSFPSELVLRLITRWVSQDASREDHFIALLEYVNWTTLDPGFIADHLDMELLYIVSQESLLTILDILDKNHVKLTSRHTEIYQNLQDKLIPNSELDQELEDSNSFLSIAINSAVMKDLEHSDVDETFSSLFLHNEPIVDANQYGLYRHPSGSEVEGYKNEDNNPPVPSSQELIPFQTNAKKNQALAGDDVVTSKGDICKTQPDRRVQEPAAGGGGTFNGKLALEPMQALGPDNRQCRTEVRQNAGSSEPCQQLASSHYSIQSPSSSQSEANVNYRGATLNNCDETYKQYNTQPTELADSFYRQQSSYLVKPNPPFTSGDLRCMQYNGYQSVSDGSFNSDLFKGDINMYREDARNNPHFVCPLFRDGQVYQSEVDHYRSLNNNQTYENFKLDGESVHERPNFLDYKNESDGAEIRGTGVAESSGSRLPEKVVERLNSNRSDFDFSEYQILEQVIQEQRLCEKTSTATKRYDPKFRALAEAFKHTEPELTSQVAPTPEIFDYKENEEKSLREDFGNCRISEKTRSKERLDCQYEDVEPMKSGVCSVPIFSMPTSQFSRYDIPMESCRPAEKPVEPSSRGQTNLLTFPAEIEGGFTESEARQFQEPGLETPPKKVPEIDSPSRSKNSSKSLSQQMILTPKEKYAKEINAERKLESVLKNVFPAEDKTVFSTTECSSGGSVGEANPSLPSPAEDIAEERDPHMLISKKKQAVDKRLDLEQADGKLIQKQKSKFKPPRKRILQNNLPTLSPEKPEEILDESPVKRIVNRKDKLLAEHRSQQNPIEIVKSPLSKSHRSPTSTETETSSINLEDLVMELNFTCPFCDNVFVKKKEFFRHVKDVHLTVKPYRCPKCEQTSTKISSILKHYNGHTSRFGCQDCQQTFVTSQELKRHEKIHKPSRMFTCPTCDKAFRLKCTLDQHQAVHSKEKKFKCRQCNYSTKYSSHLSAHKRIHDGNVHKCTFEMCDYWTVKKTLLNAHLRAHNKEKKFICKICNRGFVEAGQLRRHENIHKGVKQFKCDVENCAYSSVRKDKLKEHKSRVHKSPPVQTEGSRPSQLSGVNSYYGVGEGVELPSSQIPYVKEEEILGM